MRGGGVFEWERGHEVERGSDRVVACVKRGE
jgi:hypothetical protein